MGKTLCVQLLQSVECAFKESILWPDLDRLWDVTNHGFIYLPSFPFLYDTASSSKSNKSMIFVFKEIDNVICYAVEVKCLFTSRIIVAKKNMGNGWLCKHKYCAIRIAKRKVSCDCYQMRFRFVCKNQPKENYYA